jgi:hypothetical protein
MILEQFGQGSGLRALQQRLQRLSSAVTPVCYCQQQVMPPSQSRTAAAMSVTAMMAGKTLLPHKPGTHSLSQYLQLQVW